MMELPDYLTEQIEVFDRLSSEKDFLLRKLERSSDPFRSIVYRNLVKKIERRLHCVSADCEVVAY